MTGGFDPFGGFMDQLSSLMPNSLEVLRVLPDYSFETVLETPCQIADDRRLPEGRLVLENGDFLETHDAKLYMPFCEALLEPSLIWRVDGVLYYGLLDAANVAGIGSMIQVAVGRPRASGTSDLVFTVQGPAVEDPITKNWKPSNAAPLNVTVRLRAVKDPVVRAFVGVDESELLLAGLWGTQGAPARKPSSVPFRSVSPLTVGGVAGKLEVRMGFELDMQYRHASAVFGEAFYAVWKGH